MELTVWLGLLASALFISISPGPGAIFSISQGTQYGFKRAMFSVAGLQLGLVSQILFGWSTYRQSNICWSTQSQSNIWSTCRSNIRLVNLQLNIWLTCRSNIWLVNLQSAQTRLTCLLSCSSSQKGGQTDKLPLKWGPSEF